MTSDESVARAAYLLDRLGRLLRAQADGRGLNRAQWEALRFLARANRFSRTPSALAEFLAATRGTVSQTVIALERKGLLAKSVDDRDGRGVRLDLTEAGWDLIETSDPFSDLAAALASLPPLHVTVMAQGLSRVLDALLHSRGRRAFEVCAACRHFVRERTPGDDGGPHHCSLLDTPLSDADSRLICAEHEAA